MNQLLRKSIEYEKINAHILDPKDRPGFHLTPAVGWMNDPNGFSRYRGQYHLFYQYWPYEPFWGSPYWGHAVSDDLLRWKRLPAALAPDQEYDRDGCFSGTALPEETPEGDRQFMMYTGNVRDPKDPSGRGLQTQCIALGDGLIYRKYSGNPVIGTGDLPPDADPYEFRDPKLLKQEDGTFRALIAGRRKSGGAQILQYVSRNGLQWKYDRCLIGASLATAHLGWMWECPDLFLLDSREVLIASAIEAERTGEYPGGKTCFCMIGETGGDGGFRPEKDHPLDSGFDFYAGQTVLSPDGRRILIGWMQNPDTANRRGIELPINGQMSLPRELRLEDGRVMQRPVRELEKLYEGPEVRRTVKAEEERISVPGIRGRSLDLELSLKPAAGGYSRFGMRFAEGNGCYTEFSYDPAKSEAAIDRSRSGPGSGGMVLRRTKVRDRDGALDLRMILDRYSAEIFINDGEQVLSAVIYTGREAEDITFCVNGTAILDIAGYRIKEN